VPFREGFDSRCNENFILVPSSSLSSTLAFLDRLTLKTKLLKSFEILRTTRPTTDRRIPAEINLRHHRCEDLKSRSNRPTAWSQFSARSMLNMGWNIWTMLRSTRNIAHVSLHVGRPNQCYMDTRVRFPNWNMSGGSPSYYVHIYLQFSATAKISGWTVFMRLERNIHQSTVTCQNVTKHFYIKRIIYYVCIFRRNSFRWIQYAPKLRVIPYNFWKSSPLVKKISKDPVQYDADYGLVCCNS